MKAAFLRFNSFQKQSSSPSHPHPSPAFNAPKCILFLNVKEKRKKEKERVRGNPFAPECHILVREKGEQVAELKRCRLFCLLSLFRSPHSPFAAPLPPPALPVALKCQMQQFAAERGPWWERTALLTCRSKLFPSGPCICFSLLELSPADVVWDEGGWGGGSECFAPGSVKEGSWDTHGPFSSSDSSHLQLAHKKDSSPGPFYFLPRKRGQRDAGAQSAWLCWGLLSPPPGLPSKHFGGQDTAEQRCFIENA